jgi:sulfur carrier protein
MIQFKVNSESHQCAEGSSLQSVLSELQIETQGIAVAINQQIVTKTNWDTHEVVNQDEILIIKATQGG